MSYLEVQNMIGSESFKAGMLCGLMGIAGFLLINMLFDLIFSNGRLLYEKIKGFIWERKEKKMKKRLGFYDFKKCSDCANFDCEANGPVCICGHRLKYDAPCTDFLPRLF